MQSTWVNAEGQRIVNLMTQEAAYDNGLKPGKASIEYVNRSLKNLKDLIEQEKIESLALPRLATEAGSLDGEDWTPTHLYTLSRSRYPCLYLYLVPKRG